MSNAFNIGDNVKSSRNNDQGIVIGVYDSFYDIPVMTMTCDEWLDIQNVPFTPEEINDAWVTIELSEGSINAPFSHLIHLE